MLGTFFESLVDYHPFKDFTSYRANQANFLSKLNEFKKNSPMKVYNDATTFQEFKNQLTKSFAKIILQETDMSLGFRFTRLLNTVLCFFICHDDRAFSKHLYKAFMAATFSCLKPRNLDGFFERELESEVAELKENREKIWGDFVEILFGHISEIRIETVEVISRMIPEKCFKDKRLVSRVVSDYNR